jgi:hypothetical protein
VHLIAIALLQWALPAAAQSKTGMGSQPAGVRMDVPNARGTCPTRAEITGVLGETDSGRKIDFGGGDVEVWVSHAVDVDVHEDQCITEVYVRAKHRDRGCSLTLLFRADGSAAGLTLADAELDADSFCSGWPNAAEGVYRWRAGWQAPRIALSEDKVGDRIADRSCTDLSMTVAGDVSLARDGQRSRFALYDFTVRGVFDSVGDPRALCPSASIPAAAVARPRPAPRKRTSSDSRYDAALVGMLGMDLGLYSYRHESRSNSETDLAFGGGVTPPARVVGLNTFARYVPDWIGVETGYRLGYASVFVGNDSDKVTLSSFDLPLVAIARYDLDFARPALRLGMSVNDIQVFENDPNGQLSYGPLVLASALVGAEADIRVFERGYTRAWFDFRFARFNAYSQMGGGLEFSYTLAPPIFANAGVDFQRRSIAVFGGSEPGAAHTSTIDDHVTRFTFEIGYMR